MIPDIITMEGEGIALIQCLLCETTTMEQTLKLHIQYNHMIYKKTVLEVLFNLHYPPVSKHMVEEMLDTCEDESNIKETIKKQIFSPFHDPASTTSIRKTSTDTPRGAAKSKGNGKSSKKRKKETEIEKLKRMKLEDPPISTKKPINLKKATPTRKRLQPIVNPMLEEDPAVNDEPTTSKKKKKEGIAYDDVYTRKEMTDKQITSIQKMRQLQQNELSCVMDEGTYVQCCDCNKWRLVKEYEDPSLVPEYWVCSMNKDEEADDCNKGEGHDVESDEDVISVDYSCGSMVWVKFSGYPWWPCMVDYCPEVEETFLLDEESSTNEVAQYHVV